MGLFFGWENHFKRSPWCDLQDTAEHTLVVTVKETTNASKAGDQKDSKVLDQRLRASLAGQLQTVLKSSIGELRGLSRGNHVCNRTTTAAADILE